MAALKRWLAAALVLSIAATGQAQSPIAALASSGSFQLRGAHVDPAGAVPSWPVMPGDTFEAGDVPLAVIFPDGSSIVLAPRSSATIALAGSAPVFDLASGSARYDIRSAGAGLKFQCGGAAVLVVQEAGELQCGPSSAFHDTWWEGALQGDWWILAADAVGAGIVVARKNRPRVSRTPCSDGHGQSSGLPSCR